MAGKFELKFGEKLGVGLGMRLISGSLSDKGSKVTYATKNEEADSLGTRLIIEYRINKVM